MSDRLTTSQRKAKECMQKAEDLCAVGDTDEATRLYEKACKLDPENARYKMGLDSMKHQKESMGYFMEQLAKHKAERKYEKAAPDASQADVADAAAARKCSRVFHDIHLSSDVDVPPRLTDHPCGPDIYSGSMSIKSDELFELCWDVSGPRKTGRVRSTFSRLS